MSACEPTTWPLGTHGYGQRKVAGRTRLAHREAWEQAHGAIPAGVQVLHRCDNPPCINEEHLFLGTNAENVADRNAKGRQSRGEHRPTAKLTEVDIPRIRAMLVRGVAKQDIADAFGVGRATIRRVERRENWRHVL